MTESREDIDDLIEFELTRDCDSDDKDFIQLKVEECTAENFIEVQDDEGVDAEAEVEEEDDEDEVVLIEQLDQDDGGVYEDHDHLHHEELEVVEQDVEEADDSGELMAVEEVLEEDEEEMKANAIQYGIIEECAPIEKKPKPRRVPRGPKRYLLFDDLIATIVDYDEDLTPIVEFSIAGTEADEKLPIECGICPDVMHRTKLAQHLQTHLVEGTQNRYSCIYCEETYKDYKYLAGHSRRHMGIRPYVCEICKLYFSTKQDLRVHNQRRHQAKDLICEICGKSFSQNTMLKRHREATHEKKRRFSCEHCSKAYYKKFSLQEHVRNVHMGDRRMLVCPFCGMQCRDAHKMARHRKELHLNQDHYECTICQEEFTDINYFDAHKRSIQCRNNTKRKMEEDMMQIQQQQIDDTMVYEITVESNDEVKEAY